MFTIWFYFCVHYPTSTNLIFWFSSDQHRPSTTSTKACYSQIYKHIFESTKTHYVKVFILNFSILWYRHHMGNQVKYM
jgi:hypothetical protein